MTSRRPHRSLLHQRVQRQNDCERRRHETLRHLSVESLEPRRLLAVGPELLEIRIDGRATENGDIRHDAFRELLFQFDTDDAISSATLTGFELSRAGVNGVLGDADDVVISAGYRGLGESPNEVILRFADSLPDDVYGIHVDGSVRSVNGVRFNGGRDLDIQFTLDQGTQVISVVPQPVVRDPDTHKLSQARDQVIVYFNSQQIDPTMASNPGFYRMVDELTGGLLIPEQVQYTAATKQAVLHFAGDLPDGTYRLQVGVSDEPNNSTVAAVNIGTLVQRAPYAVYDSPVTLDENGNPMPTPIRDNLTASSRISVRDTFLVRDVEVEINMDHEYSPDLQVYLTGPSGDRVELILVSPSQGVLRPFVGTVLDDEADISITAGEGPFTGRFRPIQSLSVFDNSSVSGSWRLEIVDTATGNEGELTGWKLIVNDPADTPPDFETTSSLGDDSPAGLNDVDMYRFNVAAAGTIHVVVTPTPGLDSVVRVFNAAGADMAMFDAPGLGVVDTVSVTIPEAGTYYVGISSSGNTTYSPLDGSGASGGTSRGSYTMALSFDQPLSRNDDNSRFDTATSLGVLGKAGQTVFTAISTAPMQLKMPGSILEPGHRDIPAESHYGSGGYDGFSYVPNRLLMKFKAGVSAQAQASILASRGLTVVKNLSGTLLVEAQNGADVLQQISELASNSSVAYAEPDYQFAIDAVPNDPLFPQLWGMNNTGQSGGTVDADIDAVEAWNVTTGSEDVVIAVIDTGVDYTHPDLAANMWVNPGEVAGDGIDNDGNGYVDDIYGIDTAYGDSDPMDGHAHGTHVAGTIAAVGDNGVGVAGVNWHAKIMALKFLADNGSGDTSNAIALVDYMTMMKTMYGVNIVASNNSWGGGGYSQALEDAIQRSIDAGIVFVAAAGNSGIDNDSIPHYPSSYELDGIIAVAGTDPDDELAAVGHFGSPYDSNYGATSVDVAAPGVSILSTVPGNGYSSFGGTSMASPHVAGVIGLMAAAAPTATVAQLKNAILGGVDVIPALTGTSVTGGRLNAAESLALINSGYEPTSQSVPTAYYNFQSYYGVLPSGDTPANVITANQKDRTREIFEIYGDVLGIKFVETTNRGLTVVTGDLRAINPSIPTGPGGVAGLSEGSMGARVIMDAAEDWGISEYGGGWFTVAMHEIGHSLGLGHTYDLPALTIMGSNTIPGAPAVEPVFPGDADVIHGQFLYPTAADDIDLYRFEVPESGRVTAEIVAERMKPSSSLLDANLTLYRESTTANGVTRELIASNDDYYSSDSWLDVWLEAGTYYVAVSSSGNVGFDPATDNTGFGGKSEGLYELSLSFIADSASTLVDTPRQTKLDGDADGSPGGQFDFWFQSGPTIFVDKMNSSTNAPEGSGTLTDPYDTISTALAAAASRIVVPAAGGKALTDGDQFVVSDGTHAPVTFEFDRDGQTRSGTYPIVFAATDSPATLAIAIADAINAANNLNTTATADGSIVRLGGLKVLDLSGTKSLLSSSNLVRIVGNGGGDDSVNTLSDNVPYVIGLDTSRRPLADGAGLAVPQGVTVMIDSGALLKLMNANIDAGTSALGANRSSGSIQVLGTPEASVYFRSYRDDTAGGDSNGPGEIARPGDWGGLVFRDDSGLEQEGIFLNWVNHADINNGGGEVVVDSVREVFTPVDMTSARPTVSYSLISKSADAALSANLNAFEDSFGRIGPDVHNNRLDNNSINGLFVRIRTDLGETLDRLSVAARWDDTDIVHVVSENLLIDGTPGGPTLDDATGDFVARYDARLRVDPGMIVKLQGSRIEAEIGSQLIAEGTAERQVVFTSIKDDRFGGSGTMDTNNDLAATSAQPGQWGGLFFNAVSKGSLDHVLIAYAGGQTPIEGGFDQFAAMEIHQADVRLTNSLLTQNASGQASSNRSGRGDNEAATIFVRGAQPILVQNTLLDNAAAAISIDANSLKATTVTDWGRTTGQTDRFGDFVDNHGPMVRRNLMGNNAIRGMVVRGAVLTTESIWDDTDIAHVLFDEIILLNYHTLGGLQLRSSDHASLVVKMGNPTAGFTANGQPLDIDDRIGGSLYVLGTAKYPVQLTSLRDDEVGAGVDLNGLPLTDTNNDGPSKGAPSDWRSIRLDQYSNDRNVELLREIESVFTGGVEANATPTSAQVLGVLAPDLKSGDADRRLGFQVYGAIATDDTTDLDTYSFSARGGTEVWIDVDMTGASLDAVVELLMADGTVLASSLDNETLTGSAKPLIKDVWRGRDFYTINERDPGMRVVLPGAASQSQTYFVRLRSQPIAGEESDLDGGQSSGEYRLQVRLQQVDEIPGSIIRYADIKYATNGIEVLGLPNHSPLMGETAESTTANESLGSAQGLGNLLTSDRNVISVAGNLSAASDVDWYTFTLDYNFIQAIGGVNAGGKTWATIFDIDYADGISRPDTTISIFDANGNLILVSRDSNIEDDQPGTGQGADTDDLSRGSFGTLDSFIGSVQMPAGVIPAGSTAQYYVAISSDAQLPSALNATFTASSSNTLVRLEPVNSVQRIADDHIGFSGHVTGVSGASNLNEPLQTLFDVETSIDLDAHIVPFTLGNVVLYVSSGSRLNTVNPYTGQFETYVGNLPNGGGVLDIALRSDGRMFGAEALPGTAATAGRLVSIDWSNAAAATIGNDGIPDFDPATDPPNAEQLTSDAVDALAYLRTGADGSGVPQYDLYYSVRGMNGAPGPASTLYRANPANGSAAHVDNEPWGVRGGIYLNDPGDIGVTTGMAFLNGQLYGVSNQGYFYSISLSSGRAFNVFDVGPNFSGLTLGPQNVEGGAYANTLFAVDTSGSIYALTTNGDLRNIFNGGATSVSTGVGGATGLAFTPADVNLWHPTMQRRADAGHGINSTFDQSRPANVDWTTGIHNRSTTLKEGAASLYFGFETWQQDPQNAYFDYGVNAQYGFRSSTAHRDLASNTAIDASYNVPGGALGSLVTNAFSLSGYEVADKPTMYFNYFLATQGANSNGTDMRDSFRVMASIDGGFTWYPLATNNSVLDAELPEYLSTSAYASFDARQRVQELFDNTGGWRQARVDLMEFAGFDDIQIRFDFSTAGTMNEGTPGDEYGNFSSVQRAQQNDFEGVYIDDIIIGFTERGEMATGTTAVNTFFTVPQNPDPAGPKQVLAGPYQLEMRRGTEYGASVSGTAPEIVIFNQYDTNERMIESLQRLGDQNAQRQQGQLRIEANSIEHAAQYGIRVDAGVRDVNGVPHPGAPINLPTLNASRLVRGLTVRNNVIAESGVGGILFSGDASPTGSPLAVVPFGLLVNNTIYGGETPTGTGITVEQNASPTILNNIVANNQNGILVDGTSTSTVLGTNLFKLNTNNGVVGSNAILLAANEPLFVDAGQGNFYLSPGSKAIDSSINRLDDRPAIVAVNSPLAIPPAPIVAPETDRFGQLRVDDPLQSPPPGLGSNIFKDRGAVERADFAGPFAILTLPEDNDLAIDLDPEESRVLVEAFVVSEFALAIRDEGIGLDDRSVTTSNVVLILNGVVLRDGTDYVFRYDPIGDQIQLSVRKEVTPRRNVYEIVLNNTPLVGIRDMAANVLRPNRSNGQTRFVITTAGPNDAPVASADEYLVDEGATLTADDRLGTTPSTNDNSVLANDTDADFDVLTARLISPPSHHAGVFVLNPDGTFVYQHDGSETTSDQFTYQAMDELGVLSAVTTVHITVAPVNDVPQPVTDRYTTTEDDILDVDAPGVLANDSDADIGDSLVVSAYDAISDWGATVSIAPDGALVYNPTGSSRLQSLRPGQSVTDTFRYTVRDLAGATSTAIVAVTVHGANDAPQATADVYSTTEDDSLHVNVPGVLVNDTDRDAGDILTVTEYSAISALGAEVMISPQGELLYDPAGSLSLQALNPGEFLEDTFTYTITDLAGATSTATVTVTVHGRNDAPVARADAYTTSEDDVLHVVEPGVLGNDSDVDAGDVWTVTAFDAVSAQGATVSISASGALVYNPLTSANLQSLKPGESRQDTFTYTIRDLAGATSTATVTVTVQGRNDAPVAGADAYSTSEDDVLRVIQPGVLSNDTDADAGEVLTVIHYDAVSLSGATVTINGKGELVYDPRGALSLQRLKPGETIQDTFTYTVTDLAGATSTATVTVTVNGRNDAPVAVADRYTIDEDSLLQVVAAQGVLGNDTDVDNAVDTLRAEPRIVTTTRGVLVTLLADGSFTYDPRNVAVLQELRPGDSLEDTFTYRATDGSLFSTPATVTIEVTGVNDLPVARDDSSLVPRNGSVVYPVLNNDTDVDGTLVPTSVVVVTAPAHGTAQVQPNGSILYTPTADYRGPDTLTYRVSDNDGGVSNVATLSLLVNSVPVAKDDVVETIRNVPVTINVLANDNDSDGTLVPGSVSIVTQPTAGTVTVNADGTVRYVPATGYVGSDSFTYTVKDDMGSTSNVARVDISVIANPFPWNNPLRSLDVNADTFVTPIDALLIINDLNYRGSRKLPNPPQPPFVPPPFLDVNRDGFVTPGDALLIINYLNTGGEGEGESGAEGEGPSVDLAAAYGSTMFVDSSYAVNRLGTSAQSARRSVAPATVASVNEGLTIGREERMRYAALQDYLAESAEEDLMNLMANDVSSAWGQDAAEHAALVDLLTNVVQRAKKRD